MKRSKKNSKSLEILNETQARHTKVQLFFVLKYGLRYIILIFLSILVLVPIYWVVVTSLKTKSAILFWPPQWFPNPISLNSYKEVFKQLPMVRMTLNSVIIAVTMIVTNLVFCSLAGYTFARKRFPGKDILFLLIISTMIIPMYIRLIPIYLLTIKLGMQNSYQGIILPSAVTAFGIFLMRQYFSTLPLAIEDAARVDGCSEWGILFRIVLPESKPALTSLALFTLVESMSDFLWPLIVTSTMKMRPLPVGITLFIEDKEVYKWGQIMAMTTILIVPVIIIYAILQSQFVHGLTAGAVKE